MKESGQTELIWVKKEFASKYKELDKDGQEKAFLAYLEECSQQVKKDYKITLDSMKEDAAMFRGIMIEVRKEFDKYAREHIEASYELWENYQKDLPSLKEKVSKFMDTLSPITAELEKINKEISKINTWQVGKLTEALRAVEDLRGQSKKVFEFVVNNYKEDV